MIKGSASNRRRLIKNQYLEVTSISKGEWLRNGTNFPWEVAGFHIVVFSNTSQMPSWKRFFSQIQLAQARISELTGRCGPDQLESVLKYGIILGPWDGGGYWDLQEFVSIAGNWSQICRVPDQCLGSFLYIQVTPLFILSIYQGYQNTWSQKAYR